MTAGHSRWDHIRQGSNPIPGPFFRALPGYLKMIRVSHYTDQGPKLQGTGLGREAATPSSSWRQTGTGSGPALVEDTHQFNQAIIPLLNDLLNRAAGRHPLAAVDDLLPQGRS